MCAIKTERTTGLTTSDRAVIKETFFFLKECLHMMMKPRHSGLTQQVLRMTASSP